MLLDTWRCYYWPAACITALLWLFSPLQDLLLYTGQIGAESKIWLLDVDSEQSIFTWLSVNILSLAFLILLTFGVENRGGFARYWYVLAASFLFLSCDEHSGMHEKLSGLAKAVFPEAKGFLFFAWVIPVLLCCLVWLTYFLSFLLALPKSTVVRFVLSGVIFVTGAVGMEMVGGNLAESGGISSIWYRLATNIEEGMEALGSLMFIHSILLYRDKTVNNLAP